MSLSLTLPPPYSSLPPGYASTSGSCSSSGSRKSSGRKDSSRKSSGDDPDKERDNLKDKSDLRSIDSGHSGSTTRTQLTSRSDTLRLAIRTDVDKTAAKKVVRRARCPPEYLEEIAKTGVPHRFKTRAESKFRVVTGPEAEALFERFVGKLDGGEQDKVKSIRDYGLQHLSHPVVFAVCLVEAGRKVVDYYMTWRGKIPRVRQRRERRLSFLDSEFRRVARSLDRHYRSIISIVDNSSPLSEPARFPDPPKRHEPPPPNPPPAQEDPPRSPDVASATASVVSLPLLNMIRNVPFGNRQPLRVTNPDTASILSDMNAGGSDTPAAATSRILDTITEAAETTTVAPLTQSPTSVGSPSQPVQSDVKTKPKERHRSRESPKGSHNNSDVTRKRSSNRHKRGEERKHRSDDDDSSKRSSKRRHHDKEKGKDEDGDSNVSSEFTIVVLDDRAEKDVLSWHGLNRADVNATPRSGTTVLDLPWTGPLVNANRIIFHTPPRPADYHSFTEDDSEEDEEEDEYEYPYDWAGNSPVIPPHHNKGLGAQAHQYAPPAQPGPPKLSYAGSSGSSYATSSAATLAGTGRPDSARPPSVASSYRTAYTYPVHRSPSATPSVSSSYTYPVHRSPSTASSSSSSYVPAYIHPRHYVTPADTSLTMLQTPISYQTTGPY